MKFLRRLLLWFGIATTSIVALFLINLGVQRMSGPSAAERETLALLDAPSSPTPSGSNAFALLWLMRYDVAEADIERIAADDAREAQDRWAAHRSLVDLVPADRTLLEAPSNSESGLCPAIAAGCLAYVRDNRESARQLVTRHSRWIARMRSLESKDYYRSPLPRSLDAPFPNPGPAQRLRLSALALQWADGQHEDALSALCANAGAWRRLRHGSGSLILSMMAVSSHADAVQLFADMLAELPADQDVPVACNEAFAPIDAADVSLCSEMRGEFQLVREAVTTMSNPHWPGSGESGLVDRVWLAMMSSPAQASAWMSPRYAPACAADAVRQAMADGAFTAGPASIAPLACAGALVDCILAGVPTPGLGDYHTRLLDMAARTRLAATLLWLRETRGDTRPLAERFAARPALLRSGTRASGISADGRSLWVANHGDTQRRGERTTLVLAPEAEDGP